MTEKLTMTTMTEKLTMTMTVSSPLASTKKPTHIYYSRRRNMLNDYFAKLFRRRRIVSEAYSVILVYQAIYMGIPWS
jgi:hypothetical protein